MRRDICHYYAADVQTVYNAYLAAATNRQFRRDCKEEPYHTLTFGLNFSMKYNMNGGSCIIHFIPFGGGTAVDLRFVVAQAAGARYGRYDQDLTNAVVTVLGIPAQPLQLDIEEFMKESNKVYAQNFAAAPTMQYTAAPVNEPQPEPVQNRICTACGRELMPGDMFCGNCGTKAVCKTRFCTHCGTPAKETNAFCANCGNKL